MSKIAIDARMYSESGIGRYLRNLIGQLQRIDPDNEYFVFLRKKDFDAINLKNNFHKILADFSWYGISEQIKMPIILKKYNLDLAHFPHFNVPIFYHGKFVVTIHDLIHQHYQKETATLHKPLTYLIKQIGYKKVFKNAVMRSEKILVPSNYVKNLLVQDWKINQDKIVVTYEGVDDSLLKMKDEQTIFQKFNIMQPYIFYVGNAHPHKNIERLIKAFLNLRKNYQYLQLVLSGQDNFFWQRIKQEFKHEDIIYTGFISDEELIALYKNAKAFVMPSLEEGFGLPILEAMASGCPVISSDLGSLKEVGADAVIYFNPKDSDEMADKINLVLRDKKIRQQLIKKGKDRVKQFSFEKLAKQTLEVYLKCE